MEEKMKKRQIAERKRIFWMMAAVLVLLLIQAPAQGATNCLVGIEFDADCDGFKDIEETQISQCLAGQTNPAIACNPATKDLFIILLPLAANSLLPTDPLSMLSNAGQQNLSTTVHQINSEQVVSSPRNVTSTQKAVRVRESDLVGSYMGYSLPGTPNTTADDAYVYTKKITTTIDSICGTKRCVDEDGITLTKQGVKEKYIRHTIAHETGHMMKLRGGCTTDAGCHYPSQSNYVLDASVSYVNSGGGKKFYIGSPFTAEDSTNVQLR
jgi:hypothetical protein